MYLYVSVQSPALAIFGQLNVPFCVKFYNMHMAEGQLLIHIHSYVVHVMILITFFIKREGYRSKYTVYQLKAKTVTCNTGQFPNMATTCNVVNIYNICNISNLRC